jgi:hypothetical protein
MRISRYNFLQSFALLGVCFLLTACANSPVKSTDPNIDLHPKPVSNQLQVSLQITVPKSPTQYINANALLSNADTSYASAAASINSSNPASSSTTTSVSGNTTASNDQVFQNVQANAQSNAASSSSIKTAAALSSAQIHAIASLRPQIESVLVQYGFVPVPYQPQLQRKLTIQIVSLTNTSGLQMIIEVDAINGMLTYSKTYTGSDSLVSIGSLNTRTDKLFGDLLTQALGDSQLINFLNQS